MLITLVMGPVLIYIYCRLARTEEQDLIKQFGDGYRRYMETTPMFLPTIIKRAS